MTILNKEVSLYEGFIIPREDAETLRLNEFEYDVDTECFKGMIETEEGELRSYEYYPTNQFWHLVVLEPNY